MVKKSGGLRKKGREKDDAEPDSRERIFRAALKLFAVKGYAGTGMRKLAVEAGVNLAMINYFYGSKIGLLKRILDDFFENYVAITRRELCGAGSIEQKLRRFIKAAIGYFAANQEQLLITIAELPRDEPEITEHKALWGAKIAALIQENICLDLNERYECGLTAAMIGPPLMGLMSSYFLFRPVMEKANPPGFDHDYLARYPDVMADIFINGLNGLFKQGSPGSGNSLC